jgi:6-phosphogluconolactonase (cycloisomerase 2 family)
MRLEAIPLRLGREEHEKGAGMKIGLRARRLLVAPLRTGIVTVGVFGVGLLGTGFLTGCKNFWAAPAGSTSFALSNSGNITVTAGATGTSTISVTPSNSFTGSVSMTCAVTTSISNGSSPATCSLSPTSVLISGATAETATLTATTTSSTTTGAYEITVTGASSGATSETTTVCVEVGTSTGGCSSTASTSGIFYVLNQTTNQIAAFSISSSQLTALGTTALPASNPFAIAVAPNGNFLYVSTASGIFLYTIGSNGALTLQNNGQAISLDLATTMQVDATNSWLVDAISGIAQVNAIAINPSTGGNATSGESEQVFALSASTPVQLAISPGDSSSCNDCYVFVAMGSGGTEAIHFNPSSPNPFGSSAGTTKLVNSAGGDNALAVDPQNRLLYVGETDALSSTQTGGLRAFTIASSGITELAGSPYAAGGTGPSAILPTADGNYVYVANQSVSGSSDGNIVGFSVSTTSLTSTGSAAAGPTGRMGLAEDSTGSFILAVDFAGNPDLEAYSMSAGMLTSVLSDPTGTDPVGAVGVAAVP